LIASLNKQLVLSLTEFSKLASESNFKYPTDFIILSVFSLGKRVYANRMREVPQMHNKSLEPPSSVFAA